MNEYQLLKRKTYKENRIKGMTRENAAIAAGFGRSLATRRATIPVIVDFQALFEQKGITNKAKVDECIAGMNAEKTVRLETDETNRSGGKVYEFVSVPDWPARHKYFETMLKLCKQLDTGKQGGDTNILVIGSLAERIKRAREKNLPGLQINSANIEDGNIVVDVDVMEEENGEENTAKADHGSANEESG